MDFFNENVWIAINISLKYVPAGPSNNIPSLVQLMAWCRPRDKPLSEAIMDSLLTHMSLSLNLENEKCYATVFQYLVVVFFLVGVRVDVNVNLPEFVNEMTYNFFQRRLQLFVAL